MSPSRKGVSLRPIVNEIRKAKGALRGFRRSASRAERKKLELHIKKLDKLEQSAVSLCIALFLGVPARRK